MLCERLCCNLTEKKALFKWTVKCEQAFTSFKTHLTSAPTLALPDWSQQFIVDTDASDAGIGAVLSQVHLDGTEHVICYTSRILTKSERNYVLCNSKRAPGHDLLSPALSSVPVKCSIHPPNRPWCTNLASAVQRARRATCTMAGETSRI